MESTQGIAMVQGQKRQRVLMPVDINAADGDEPSSGQGLSEYEIQVRFNHLVLYNPNNPCSVWSASGTTSNACKLSD